MNAEIIYAAMRADEQLKATPGIVRLRYQKLYNLNVADPLMFHIEVHGPKLRFSVSWEGAEPVTSPEYEMEFSPVNEDFYKKFINGLDNAAHDVMREVRLKDRL